MQWVAPMAGLRQCRLRSEGGEEEICLVQMQIRGTGGTEETYNEKQTGTFDEPEQGWRYIQSGTCRVCSFHLKGAGEDGLSTAIPRARLEMHPLVDQ